ncbi:MFS transporter [bacterium]|jgi:MFS family permease|nr:MFS transporter [bacterium]
MNVVLFPAYLIHHGISESLIGFSFSVELIASMVISFYVPHLTKKFKVTNTLITMTSLYALFIVLLPFYINFITWLALIFFLGINLFGAMTISNSLYNQFLSNQKRAWYLSVMTIAICTGLSIGPLIAGGLDPLHYKSFFISGFFALLSTVPPFILLKNKYKIPEHRHVKILYFIKKEPIVFMAKFTQEFIVSSIFTLTVVYLIQNGHTLKQAGLALSIFAASAIVDLIIGYLADRYNKYKLVSIGVTGTLFCITLLFLQAHNLRVILPIFFGLGICAGLMHISLSSLLNNQFPKTSLISANAALLLVGSSGGITGALLIGITMQYFGKSGFPIMIMGICLIYLLLNPIIRKVHTPPKTDIRFNR